MDHRVLSAHRADQHVRSTACLPVGGQRLSCVFQPGQIAGRHLLED